MKSRRSSAAQRGGPGAGEAPRPDTDDLDAFLAALGERYTGRITQLHPQRGVGQIETAGGRVLTFSLALVRVGGRVDHPRRLRRGMRVSFDVARTDAGLQIVALWVGDQPWRPPGEEPERR